MVAKYHQDDIFACDVTELAFRRSPMADRTSTSLFKVVLTCNASGTEKLNPKLVCSEEMDDHTQLEPYLTNSVLEPDVYTTIDRELEGEMSLYMGADDTVQNAVEEHLLNFSNWFTATLSITISFLLSTLADSVCPELHA